MDFRQTMFSSDRLRLAAFQAEDAVESFPVITPNLTRFMTFDPEPSLRAFSKVWADWFPQMARGTDIHLAIRLAVTQEFVGMVGLHNIDDPEPEAGIWIKEAAHGIGHGLEAVTALMQWARQATQAHGILYSVVEQNRPSRPVAEKLGGEIVGH